MDLTLQDAAPPRLYQGWVCFASFILGVEENNCTRGARDRGLAGQGLSKGREMALKTERQWQWQRRREAETHLASSLPCYAALCCMLITVHCYAASLRRDVLLCAVYCAHEYTQANARFALSVDPDNKALQARCWCRAQGRQIFSGFVHGRPFFCGVRPVFGDCDHLSRICYA